MEITRIILSYVQALAWPTVAIVILLRYRRVIERLLPSTKIRLTIAGVTIETTLETLRNSIEDVQQDVHFDSDQFARLDALKKHGRVNFDPAADYAALQPLRNSGLIRPVPKGYLAAAKQVELTSLGQLFVQARKERSS